eukprot:c21808_g1_i1 orf=27-977(+)
MWNAVRRRCLVELREMRVCEHVDVKRCVRVWCRRMLTWARGNGMNPPRSSQLERLLNPDQFSELCRVSPVMRSRSSCRLETARESLRDGSVASTGKQVQVPSDFCLFNDYAHYRRFLNGGLAYKALFVDVTGTLIVPSQPTAKVYHDIGQRYGVKYNEDEILARYRWAYSQPWFRSRLRYEADARPFWRYIVKQSTGCEDPDYLEELYQYYTTAKAWDLAEPNAGDIFKALKAAGVKVAVVSNFDTRLRPLLRTLSCDDWFDAMAVSAEVGAEKPNPVIFWAACELLGVKPQDVVHIGDDRRNDIWGARDAGCDAW